MESLSDRSYKLAEKGEHAGYQPFLLFNRLFLQSLPQQNCENRESFGIALGTLCFCFCFLKVALQILVQKFYKNTKKSSLYSQNILIFVYRTPVVERHPITRKIRYLLWHRSTPTGNTVYF